MGIGKSRRASYILFPKAIWLPNEVENKIKALKISGK